MSVTKNLLAIFRYLNEILTDSCNLFLYLKGRKFRGFHGFLQKSREFSSFKVLHWRYPPLLTVLQYITGTFELCEWQTGSDTSRPCRVVSWIAKKFLNKSSFRPSITNFGRATSINKPKAYTPIKFLCQALITWYPNNPFPVINIRIWIQLLLDIFLKNYVKTDIRRLQIAPLVVTFILEISEKQLNCLSIVHNQI